MNHFDQRTVLEAFSRTLGQEAHNLREYPHLLWQQMYNRLQWINNKRKFKQGNPIASTISRHFQERITGETYWFHQLNKGRESQQLIKTLVGHVGWVYSVAFASSGDRLISGSEDGSVRIWDVTTGIQMAKFGWAPSDSRLKHEYYYKPDILGVGGGGIRDVALSPSCNKIATCREDGTVWIWEVSTKKPTTLLSNKHAVRAVAFSPSGDLIVSGSEDGTVLLSDSVTGLTIATFRTNANEVLAVAFSPSGDWIASGSKDGIVRIWDVTTNMLRATLKCSNGHFQSLAFSPSGDIIATANWDKTIRLWDLNTEQEMATLRGHSDAIVAIAYSPSGRTVASGSLDGTVRIWETKSNKQVASLGYGRWIKTIKFAPSGDLIATTSWFDENIRIWDVTTEGEAEIIGDRPKGILAIDYSPRGDQIASLSSDGTVTLSCASTGKLLATLGCKGGGIHSLNNIVFSPSNELIAIGNEDGTIKIWEMATGNESVLSDHGSPVTAVAFCPSGDLVASGSEDGAVRFWNAATWNESDVLEEINISGTDRFVWELVFSPSGNEIVSVSPEGTFRSWEMTTGKNEVELKGPRNAIHFEFTPFREIIVSANEKGLVRLWDVATGETVVALHGHRKIVLTIAFSPCGKRVATGSLDGTVRLWDVTTGKEIGCFPTLGAIFCVAIDCTGKQITSAGDKGNVDVLEFIGDFERERPICEK